MLHYQFIKAWAQTKAESERGASLVEYALLVALIAVVCIGAVSLLGTSASDNFTEITDEIAVAP